MNEATTGPLSQIWELVVSNTPRDLRIESLVIMLVIAVVIYFLSKGEASRGADGKARKASFWQFLLPKDIYQHESARVDVYLWILERIFHPLWAIAVLAFVGPHVELLVIYGLEAIATSPALEINYGWMLLYSLVTLLCYDFVFFGIHYTFHKVPALWVIHKVHHSAEVLTPLTRYREHVIAGPIWAVGAGLSYGVAGGIFGYFFSSDITAATILNISVFALLFGFNGAFRHYHVQFHYPVWLSKWLHSPVMHHVHHSYLPKHIDTNFASVTSIFDRMLGTLYIPEKDEDTPWGLGPDTQDEYRSFTQNAAGPFRDWYAMLTTRSAKNELED